MLYNGDYAGVVSMLAYVGVACVLLVSRNIEGMIFYERYDIISRKVRLLFSACVFVGRRLQRAKT